MHEFFSVPNNIDLHKIEKLHHNVHDMNRILGLLDCSQTKRKNCPKAWAGSYQSKETLPQLFSRELRTIIFFGIHCTVMQEHSTIKHYFTCPLFRSAFWMDLLGRESADLGWFHSKLQMKSTKSLSCGWHLYELCLFC